MSGPWQRPPSPVVLLAAALVAALAAGAWLVVQLRAADDDLVSARERAQALEGQAAAEQDALQAARDVLEQVTTYSWKEGEHDFGWLDRIGDDELRERLAPNVGDLQEAIVDGRVSAEGQVVDAVARGVDAAQVEVLAFVDQAITDETSPDVKIEEQRVSMTLRLVDEAWLVTRLELLSGAGASPAE